MPVVGYGSAYSCWNTNLATVTTRWIFRNQSLIVKKLSLLGSNTYVGNCFRFAVVFYYIFSAISNIYSAVTNIFSAFFKIFSAISNIYSVISYIYFAISYIYFAISYIYFAISNIYSAISNIYSAVFYIFSVLPLSFNFSTYISSLFPSLLYFFFRNSLFHVFHWFWCPVLLLRYILLFIPCSAVGTFMV